MNEERVISLGDLNEVEEQINFLTQSLTANSTEDIGKFFTDLVVRLRVMERQIEEYKKFIPIMYHQVSLGNVHRDGIFKINIGPYTPISQSLLMMLPKEASIDGDNKLVLLRNNEELISFDIYRESNTGQLLKIRKGDIVPSRTVLFRFIYNQIAHPRAVIINTSGLYNENVSNLFVSGEALFSEPPIIPNGTFQDRLATKSEVDKLVREIKEFKDLFIFTKENARDVAERSSTPDGSIIIEIDHD